MAGADRQERDRGRSVGRTGAGLRRPSSQAFFLEEVEVVAICS